MNHQIPISRAAVLDSLDDTNEAHGSDVVRKRLAIVNVVFVGHPGGRWVLIDAGIYGSASFIRRFARQRFGDRKPEAIILTQSRRRC